MTMAGMKFEADLRQEVTVTSAVRTFETVLKNMDAGSVPYLAIELCINYVDNNF